ncbi:FliM/FliN family flagellar motor switch protein [Nitratireductor rhodophyticola]|uniref:FliM/FliN family flagellar motor switch protein n=1 Tax=Nitratireductor rhodophyticola TaxID=2854036 RepID=UPI0008141AFD|nr:FliM/FliN family flagellar motor switch protein [Nitratireductor rhodophyticola]MEC9245781.1 FliM/FliN family flagellar motor switch protein [Pseudomonadota bacterium]WPZ12691.1 FliM/FliN family flagellar motor switch protein [Nitratireductor rhodophyticola]
MALTEDPELMRALVVERLVGATGDPRKVVEAARSCATRALPRVMESLEEKLPTPIAVDLVDVEIVRLAELKPQPDCCDALVVVSGEVSGDALTMRLDPTAISLLVGAMFGGNPELPAVPVERPPSAIERDVAAHAFELFAKALNGKGARSLGLRLQMPTVLAGADFRRFVVRDGPGVRIRFAVGGEEQGGLLTAWMPQRLLLETRDAETDDKRQQNAKAADWHNRFSDEVMRSNVRLKATIPLMRMALGQLASLHEGQVIEFGDGAQPEARLAVRDKTVFTCDFGKAGHHYTVRIKQPFDARKDVVEGLLAQ